MVTSFCVWLSSSLCAISAIRLGIGEATTILTRGELAGAKFSDCRFEEVEFEECNLEGTQFLGCDLTDVSFGEGDEASNLKGAKYDAKTKFADDFEPDAWGMVKV